MLEANKSDSASYSKQELILKSLASCLCSGRKPVNDSPRGSSSEALNYLFSPLVPSVGPRLTVPSCYIQHGSTNCSNHRDIKEKIASSLATPLLFDESGDKANNFLTDAPMKILNNITASFTSLVDSRLRRSLKAFQNITSSKSQGRGFTSESSFLMKLLDNSESRSILPTTCVTSFRAFSKNSDIQTFGQHDQSFAQTQDLVLGLVLEVTIDLVFAGSNQTTVQFHTPGNIKGMFNTGILNETGKFASESEKEELILELLASNGYQNASNVDDLVNGDGMLQSVEISLDIHTLLESMIKQARVVVKWAMHEAVRLAKLLSLVQSLNNFTTQALITKPSIKSLSSSSLEFERLLLRENFEKASQNSLHSLQSHSKEIHHSKSELDDVFKQYHDGNQDKELIKKSIPLPRTLEQKPVSESKLGNHNYKDSSKENSLDDVIKIIKSPDELVPTSHRPSNETDFTERLKNQNSKPKVQLEKSISDTAEYGLALLHEASLLKRKHEDITNNKTDKKNNDFPGKSGLQVMKNKKSFSIPLRKRVVSSNLEV
mmetsp:Transcript_1744/g.2509  ORF Transcript_1744/g.2509 Transcript_1744/m.2509 type:complete len:546 (+) Transcript_1744:83-1720(+)